MTNIDQICKETAQDVTKVYESRIIQDMVGWNKPYAVWDADSLPLQILQMQQLIIYLLNIMT